MAVVGGLLPATADTHSLDRQPPRILASMLQHSRLLDVAGELLASDPIDEALKRAPLYASLVGFVRRLATHPVIARTCIYEGWPDKSISDSLLQSSFVRTPNPLESDTRRPLASCLDKLKAQWDVMLKNAQRNVEEFRT